MRKNDWKEFRLGDIATILSGGDAPRGHISKFKTKNYCVPIYSNGISAKGLYGYTDKATVFEPASTITARGTIGVVYKRAEPYMPIVRLISVIAKKKVVDSDFLYYTLCNTKISGNGSVQAQLTVPMISEYIVRLPDLTVQKKIAHLLSLIDAKIEINTQINQNLEAQAQALFKSWFVDFEPFRNGKFVDSELGQIPDGWRVGTLGEVATVTSGKRPAQKAGHWSANYQYPIVGASCVMGFTNNYLCGGPIIVTGRVGTHGVIQYLNQKCWPSDNTLVINSQYIEFIYQYLHTIDFNLLNRGSTQPLITQADVKKQSCLIATADVFSKFEAMMSCGRSLVQKNLQESQRLVCVRNTLLPKLMSGEIDVSKVEV